MNPYKLHDALGEMSEKVEASGPGEVTPEWLDQCADAAGELVLELSKKQSDGDRGSIRELRAKARVFDLEEENSRLRAELDENSSLVKCKAHIFDLQNEIGKLRHEIVRLERRNKFNEDDVDNEV